MEYLFYFHVADVSHSTFHSFQYMLYLRNNLLLGKGKNYYTEELIVERTERIIYNVGYYNDDAVTFVKVATLGWMVGKAVDDAEGKHD